MPRKYEWIIFKFNKFFLKVFIYFLFFLGMFVCLILTAKTDNIYAHETIKTHLTASHILQTFFLIQNLNLKRSFVFNYKRTILHMKGYRWRNSLCWYIIMINDFFKNIMLLIIQTFLYKGCQAQVWLWPPPPFRLLNLCDDTL